MAETPYRFYGKLESLKNCHLQILPRIHCLHKKLNMESVYYCCWLYVYTHMRALSCIAGKEFLFSVITNVKRHDLFALTLWAIRACSSFICWCNRLAVIVLYNELLYCTCQGGIRASVICLLYRFILVWCRDRATNASSCCFDDLFYHSSFCSITSYAQSMTWVWFSALTGLLFSLLAVYFHCVKALCVARALVKYKM